MEVSSVTNPIATTVETPINVDVPDDVGDDTTTESKTNSKGDRSKGTTIVSKSTLQSYCYLHNLSNKDFCATTRKLAIIWN
jgi:hypothetical protein